MIRALLERWRQGHRTIAFPPEETALPDRFRGRPVIDSTKCPDGCQACIDACPTDALRLIDGKLALDLGRCLFCSDCQDACPEGAVSHTRDFRLATRTREALVIEDGRTLELAQALDDKSRAIFGRSLKLRQVSAGGCNGCELDLNVLNTVVFDLGRFGIQFVASPRHADALIVTGTVPKNMLLALRKTWDATPSPKLVIAVGACAISGGPFVDHPEHQNGVGSMLQPDLYIPGCPPHPATILDGLLRLIDRMPR